MYPFIMSALAQGKSVPEDLSLLVVDDHPNVALGMGIDTMVLPRERIGAEAVDMMEDILQGRIETGKFGDSWFHEAQDKIFRQVSLTGPG